MAHKRRVGWGRGSANRLRRLLQILILVAAAICRFEPSYVAQAAEELPTTPILRIEAGRHIGRVQRVDTDAANRFVVTASYDKTVRVWSLPEGRLLRVLRLPMGDGDLGKAYAVAISPDGDTIAVSGWTSRTGTSESIFLFDRESGAIKQRLLDLPALSTT